MQRQWQPVSCSVTYPNEISHGYQLVTSFSTRERERDELLMCSDSFYVSERVSVYWGRGRAPAVFMFLCLWCSQPSRSVSMPVNQVAGACLSSRCYAWLPMLGCTEICTSPEREPAERGGLICHTDHCPDPLWQMCSLTHTDDSTVQEASTVNTCLLWGHWHAAGTCCKCVKI